MGSDVKEETADRILENLRRLKKYGKDLGEEIDRQTPMINNLDP